MSRNSLYSLILIACFAGYIWLFYSTSEFADKRHTGVCLIKQATNIPCPSCGSTRSIISLTEGDFIEALKLNPIGYLVAIIMLTVPVWIASDIVQGKETMFKFYQRTEAHLKKPKYAIALLSLVVINWIWNIAKGL